jgi:Ca-activated chloride channel homolog
MKRLILITATSLLFAGCNLDWRDPVSRKVEKGNAQMAKGDVGEALNSYRDAQIDAPDDGRIHYNIGNALFGERKFEDAVESWSRASTRGDDTLASKSSYNAGNAWFKQRKLDKAAEAYQRSLELNPGDMDAKFNLELVQRLLMEAANRSDSTKKQQKQTRASQWARDRAQQAEGLAKQGRFGPAFLMMKRTLDADATARGEFADFTKRLAALAKIFGGGR